MSTIKINELATTDIALTDFIAKADANGLMTKNTITNLSTFIETVGEVGFKGSVLIADDPTQDGWYLAGEAGTFPNIGGLVALAQSVTIFVISDSDTTYSKIDIPLTLPFDSVPTLGSTNAVESGGIVNYFESSSNEKYEKLFSSNLDNLIPLNDIIGETFSNVGLSIEIDRDGAIVVNGTSTSSTSFELLPNITSSAGATPYFTLLNGTEYKLKIELISGEASSSASSYIKAIGASSNNYSLSSSNDVLTSTPSGDLDIGRFTFSVNSAGVVFTNAKYVIYVVETANYLKEYKGLSPILQPRTIGGAQLTEDSVDTNNIINDAVTNDKIANDSITTDKVSDNIITSSKLVNESVLNSKRTKAGDFAIIESSSEYPFVINTSAQTITIENGSRIISNRSTRAITDFGLDKVIDISSVQNGILLADLSGTGGISDSEIRVINGSQTASNIINENEVFLLAYYNYGEYVYSQTPYTIDNKPFGLIIGESRISMLYNSSKEPLSFSSGSKTCIVNAGSRAFINSKNITLPTTATTLDLTVDYNNNPTTFGSIIVYDTLEDNFKVLSHSNNVFKDEWYLIATTKGMSGGSTSTPVISTPTAFEVDGNSYGINIPGDEPNVEIFSPSFETIDLPSGLSLWQDFLIINTGSVKEMWFFRASREEDHRFTDGEIYRVNMSDWSYIGSISHNFGHCNSVDYDSVNDRIIVGNLPGHYITEEEMPIAASNYAAYYIKYTGTTTVDNSGNDNDDYIPNHYYGARETNGNWYWEDFTNATPAFDGSYQNALYIFYNVSDWILETNLDFHTVDKTIVDVTADGLTNVNGCFAETKDIVHVAGGKHGRILLGKGTNDLGSGNYSASAVDKFNGSYQVLRGFYSYPNPFPDSGKEVIQGTAYVRGQFITANGHDGVLGLIWSFTEDKILRNQIEVLLYNEDGSEKEIWSEGISYDKENDVIYQGAIEIGSPNVYRIVEYKPL